MANDIEAVRAAFLAWIRDDGYLVSSAVTDIEWDDEGLPIYYTRNDGVRHYLDGEWHAWQAARALPLPARDDAVEEALTAAQALIRHLSQGMAGLARADDDMERLYFVPKIVAAYAEFNEVGAKIDAALRREKESRSDDSRPASGQGGAK